MLRITKITTQSPYFLLCEFNYHEIRKLDALPIIQSHLHLKGVERLLNESVFQNVGIGQFGEIVWKDIVVTIQNDEQIVWDYDISPEFAFQNSIDQLELV
ncbi:MAG: hypothetical protein WCJ03_09620 [Bacteroidales bacterium]